MSYEINLGGLHREIHKSDAVSRIHFTTFVCFFNKLSFPCLFSQKSFVTITKLYSALIKIH